MRIVTSRHKVMDMGAYGACVAYAELLDRLGVSAVFVSTADFDYSIPSTVQDWGMPIEPDYQPRADDKFSLIGVSNPKDGEKFVDIDRVAEVVDHRLGAEGIWSDHPRTKADIEQVGSSSTMVFERWLRADRVEDMSELSIRLLLTGILHDTLKLSAFTTTERDKRAYAHLMMMTDLPLDWPERYFSDCQLLIEANIKKAINFGAQDVDFPGLNHPVAVSQLVVFNGMDIARRRQDIIADVDALSSHNLVSIACISERINYLVTSDKQVQEYITPVIGASFEDGIAQTDRLWLRSELLMGALERWHNQE